MGDRPTDPLVQARLDAEHAIDAVPLEREPISVMTRAEHADQLAGDMTERVLVRHLQDLPVLLRVRLTLWCVDYLTWQEGQPR